ncbi:MAG: hypothetical protein A2289_04605 [Deltaproteobacteria bacterium RIFOXYA12_FULL_58_15]|nr:MAG: hypothetical protein A2289_04605 [Deltaproteobacteria bacterium RIFOXYA12_FULL_58_15]OGR08812.1 MAG: hypothetical protein A2341_10390 [Deltaproteobacteria bacterium RIFOXYB12_FULL_58_9]
MVQKSSRHSIAAKGTPKKSEITRERLLSTTEILFADKGYSGTSLAEITRYAGVTKGLFYYYFSDKEALFDAIVERYFDAHAEVLINAISGERTLSEKLHRALDGYLDIVEVNPLLIRIIQHEACSESEQMRKISNLLKPILTLGNEMLGAYLPPEGPFSPRHFFLSVFGMGMSYFVYAPLLEELWGLDPLGWDRCAERRKHLHGVVDSLVNTYFRSGETPSIPIRLDQEEQ